jgi:hypothetical protein
MKKFRDIPMKVTLKNSAIILSSLILAACGSDSDDHSDAHEEHEHALMISQQYTTALSFLEEGAAENLDDAAAANGAALLLSNTGEHAAIITAGQVQFVAAHLEEEEEGEAHDEEEHELPELSTLELTSTAQPIVANTIGHFSVLVDGATQLVPYELLEEGQIPDSEPLSLGITETYPALLLEEGDEVVSLAFNGTNAVVYEDDTATLDTQACATVNSTVHSGEFALVSCDNASFSVKLEEGESDHTIEITTIAGVSTPVTWATRGGVFVGRGNDDKFYVLEENADEELELEGSAFDATEESAELCDWGIDSLEADIFALTASKVTIFDHEGESHSITLDETQNAGCDDLRMTTSNSAVFVFDNLNGVLYEIDKEEDATEYHIHGREDLSVDDVADAVNFHEVGTESHDHEH